MRPVGPEDSQIYWKRRVLFGGIVVLALILLWAVFLRGGSDPEAEPVAAPSESTSPSPSPTPTPTPSNGECADEDIEVLASTDSTTYPEGSLPKITMSIENVGETPCKRDIGSANNEIIVTSGGVDVYSSDTCSPLAEPDDADEKTLKPGQSAKVTVEWDRKLTTAGCPGEELAAPGTYDAVGRNGEIKSEKATFVLG
jgi:hypothetical protein